MAWTGIDTRLIGGWLRARSVARGLPPPVEDHGGWRVDTGSPQELRRYVFARPGSGLRALAETIDTPRVFLKLCGSEREMRALLPPRWQCQEPRHVMTGERYRGHLPPPPHGYSLEVSGAGAATTVRIVTDEGELAASGHAAELDGFFVYDQIITEARHRRRGLGSWVMHALYSARQSGTSIQLLVATAAGQALYRSLGWRTCSPYTTAHIPCPPDASVRGSAPPSTPSIPSDRRP